MDQEKLAATSKRPKQDPSEEHWSKDMDKNLIKRLQKYCVKQQNINLPVARNQSQKVRKNLREMQEVDEDNSESSNLDLRNVQNM